MTRGKLLGIHPPEYVPQTFRHFLHEKTLDGDDDDPDAVALAGEILSCFDGCMGPVRSPSRIREHLVEAHGASGSTLETFDALVREFEG
jgi:hypothetical protein